MPKRTARWHPVCMRTGTVMQRPPSSPSDLSPRTARFLTWSMLLVVVLLFVSSLRASYEDIIAAFETIRTGTVFPVHGKTFDDIEETFGPRGQPSLNGAYDWHRGIDIDGAGGENVYNVYDGVFEKIDYTASAGNYVVIKHTLPGSVTYGPNPSKQNWTTFYTYYMHLTDETVTHITNQGWSKGTSVNAGTVIGYLGSTGGSGGNDYAPHLHFELRFGTSNPLSNQIAGDGLTATDAWFDPHMNPLLLFNPNDAALRGASINHAYTQTLTRQADDTVADALSLLYTSSLDELPMVNAFTVDVKLTATGEVVQTHTLDFNQRIGYDASTNALLDTPDKTVPYMVPLAFTDAQTNYQTSLAVPHAWLGAMLDNPEYAITVTASDIWGATTSLTVSAIPEPATYALLAGLFGLWCAVKQRRRNASRV